MEDTQEKLDNTVRITIALPLALSIKLEADKQITNDSRSSWIRKAIEEKLSRAKDELSVQDKVKFLEEKVAKLEGIK